MCVVVQIIRTNDLMIVVGWYYYRRDYFHEAPNVRLSADTFRLNPIWSIGNGGMKGWLVNWELIESD